MQELISFGTLIFKLGFAVYEAVQSGDTSRTVGEIFAGVPKDEPEIERLRQDAHEKYLRMAAALEASKL